MSTTHNEMQIFGLTKLDQLELKKHLHESELKFKEENVNETDFHELATTTAVVIVSLAALRVIAVWVAKSKKTVTFSKTFREIDGKGSIREGHTEFTVDGSKSEPEILEQLAKQTNVDTTPLLIDNPTDNLLKNE